jgi:hypothetical protein
MKAKAMILFPFRFCMSLLLLTLAGTPQNLRSVGGHGYLPPAPSGFNPLGEASHSSGFILAQYATTCTTPHGQCPVPPNTPVGSPCTCYTPLGTYLGTAR